MIANQQLNRSSSRRGEWLRFAMKVGGFMYRRAPPRLSGHHGGTNLYAETL